MFMGSAYFEGYDMAKAKVLELLDHEITEHLAQAEEKDRHPTDRTMQRIFAEVIGNIRDKVAALGCD